MATAEQIKSLIRSHLSDDEERFHTIALQVAAHEARQGHGEAAKEIRDIVEKAKQNRGGAKVISFTPELGELVFNHRIEVRLGQMVVADTLANRINRIVREYKQQEKLKKHGKSHRRKILLSGPPGTGKTMTAHVLATETHLPCNAIQVDKLVTKFMGETTAKLRQIFDLIAAEPGVYLFDEFDAIGGDRSLNNDVGEMRRVLNAFLQFLEQDDSGSLIICATNNTHLLDNALFRRFDDVLHYTLPDEEDRRSLIENVLGTFRGRIGWKTILTESEGLSHAELDSACRNAIKEAILSDNTKVTTQILKEMIHERQQSHNRTSNRN